MPKVKEGFSWKHQGNINVPVEEVSFSAGEDVQIIKEWQNETCLIRKGDKVLNIPKKYLS